MTKQCECLLGRDVLDLLEAVGPVGVALAHALAVEAREPRRVRMRPIALEVPPVHRVVHMTRKRLTKKTNDMIHSLPEGY